MVGKINPRVLLEMFGRAAVSELKPIVERAAASGLKSVAEDVKAFVGGIDNRLNNFIAGCESVAGGLEPEARTPPQEIEVEIVSETPKRSKKQPKRRSRR